MEYQFESIGPALRWIVLAFLFLFVILLVAAFVGLAALPGWIARRKQHPQADAINICGWFGLPSGILWVLAIVWAYTERSNGTALAMSKDTCLDDVRQMNEAVAQLEAAISKLEGTNR